jgi:glycosyltransferase involved in cell wall biosynthesis
MVKHVTVDSWNWALTQANVHMVHFTQIPMIARLKPKVFVIHGSLEASLYSELDPSQHKFASLSVAIQLMNSCDASIAIHRRQYDNYKQFDYSNKLSYVRRGVDLERWRPTGSKMNLDGEPAVLYGEQWRHQKDPLMSLYAMYELGRKNKNARLHVYNCEDYRDTWQEVMYAGRFHEILGKWQLSGHQTFPEQWYRGASMTISPNLMGEDSRVSIESLACGTPVVAWDSNPFEDYKATVRAKPFDYVDMANKIQGLHEQMQYNGKKIRAECVKYAKENFDMAQTANAIAGICKQLSGGEK